MACSKIRYINGELDSIIRSRQATMYINLRGYTHITTSKIRKITSILGTYSYLHVDPFCLEPREQTSMVNHL